MTNETTPTPQQQIEQKALRIFELTRQQALAEEEKTLLKKTVAQLLNEQGDEEHFVDLDDSHMLKISISERTTKKLDKESLAEDLGISIEGAGKKDVLIKQVEEGKLTLQQYRDYEYDEHTEQLSVRKVKANA